MNQNASKGMYAFFALFPILMTILDPYALTDGGSILICDLSILCVCVYLLYRNKLAFYKPLLILLCFDFVLSLLAFAVTASVNMDLFLSIKVAMVFLLYLLVYSSIWTLNIKESFFRFAEIAGIICALLAILQFIFASLGFDFYDGRLFLPLGDGSHFGGLRDRNTGDLRVHSFFEEPSYLAFFEIPITAHLIQKRKHIKALICGLSCIVAGSMIGVLGLVLVVVSILLLDTDVKKQFKFVLVIVIAAIMVLMMCFYSSNAAFAQLFDYYFDRGMNMESSMEREDSSFSQRIIGNIALFSKYQPVNKLIGFGFNQYSLYFGINKDYSNDFVSNLLNFGYLGMLAMIFSIILIYNKISGHGRIFFLIFILLLAVDHSWFGTMFFYILTWVIMKSDNISNYFTKMRYIV